MIDTSRYQWMIGGIALVMVIAFSVVLYTHGHHTRPGVPVGRKLPQFVAPLAVGGPNASANVHPECNPAKPVSGGLSVCHRKALVLDLFAADGSPCVSSVDALQQASRSYARSGGFRSATVTGAALRPEFAAVAAGGSQSQTRALVRQHHWTIPVGFDPSGVVGELYGVTLCPMIELASADGTVRKLLIGDRYEHASAIEAAVASVFGR